MFKAIKPMFILITSLCFSLIASAQALCPEQVDAALSQLDRACQALERNQVCYGNNQIQALDITGQSLPDFANPSDVIALDDVATLSLSGFSASPEEWGIAVLKIQANIPNTLPGQNLTMLLFGDTELNTDSQDASAFVFSSGIGQSNCQAAPNGMMIQTPEGVASVYFRLNNIEIELGSTAYIRAEKAGVFQFFLLEGLSTLRFEGQEAHLEGGQYTSIRLDEAGNAAGVFNTVQTIEGRLTLPPLPTDSLNQLAEASTVEVTPESTESSENTDSSNSEGRIVPLMGNWTVVITNVSADGCPAMMTDAFTQQLFNNETVLLDFGGEDWSFEDFFRTETGQNTEQWVQDGIFSSPELNVYHYEMNVEDVPFTFIMRVLSESEMAGEYIFDATSIFEGCILEVTYSVTLNQ